MKNILSKIATGQAPATPEDAYLMEQNKRAGIKPGTGIKPDGFLNVVNEEYSTRNIKWQTVKPTDVFGLYENDFQKTNQICQAITGLKPGNVIQLTVEGKEYFLKPNTANSFLLASYDNRAIKEEPDNLSSVQLDEAFSDNSFKDEVKELKNPRLKSSVESLMSMSASLRSPAKPKVNTLSESKQVKTTSLKEVNRLFMTVQGHVMKGNKNLEELADAISDTLAEAILEDYSAVNSNTMAHFVAVYNKKTGGKYKW